MDISLADINSTYQILETTSSYPRRDDCLNVVVTQENNITFEASHFSKTKLMLIFQIQRIAEKLTNEDVNDLIKKINDHVEYAADVARDDEAGAWQNELSS